MISKEFRKYLANQFQEIFDSITTDKGTGRSASLKRILKVHKKMSELWDSYFLDLNKFEPEWSYGNDVIAQSLGNIAIMYDDYGPPDSESIGEELADIIKDTKNPETLKMDKEFKEWYKKKELHTDFNEKFEEEFIPSKWKK